MENLSHSASLHAAAPVPPHHGTKHNNSFRLSTPVNSAVLGVIAFEVASNVDRSIWSGPYGNYSNIAIPLRVGKRTRVVHVMPGYTTGAGFNFIGGQNAGSAANVSLRNVQMYFTTVDDPSSRAIVNAIAQGEFNPKKEITGSGAPSSTPYWIGMRYIDTTNRKMYVSTGFSSSSDWTILN